MVTGETYGRFTMNGSAQTVPDMSRAPGLASAPWITWVRTANPLELIELEQRGMSAVALQQLASELDVSLSRLYAWIGSPIDGVGPVSESSAFAGAPTQSAIGIAQLVGVAEGIVARSTSNQAAGFDAAKWLVGWLDTPHPALQGMTPGAVVSTRTGLRLAKRMLYAIEYGSFL